MDHVLAGCHHHLGRVSHRQRSLERITRLRVGRAGGLDRIGPGRGFLEDRVMAVSGEDMVGAHGAFPQFSYFYSILILKRVALRRSRSSVPSSLRPLLDKPYECHERWDNPALKPSLVNISRDRTRFYVFAKILGEINLD
jgi:hypothetical protein